MKRGRIVGEIWASRRVADLSGRSLKLVVTPSGQESSGHSAAGAAPADDEPALDLTALAWESLTVAIDTLDARVGQEVLVAYGSGARNVLSAGPGNRELLCDAAVALLIDAPTQPAEPALVSRPLSPSSRKAG